MAISFKMLNKEYHKSITEHQDSREHDEDHRMLHYKCPQSVTQLSNRALSLLRRNI